MRIYRAMPATTASNPRQRGTRAATAPSRIAFVAAATILLGSAGSDAFAHHSVAAAYDTSRVIILDGRVRSLDIGFPHSHLVIEVRMPDGRAVAWQAELASAAVLRRAGWTNQSLSVGEHVHLTGSPGRYSDTELYVLSVTREDGSILSLKPPSAAGDR